MIPKVRFFVTAAAAETISVGSSTPHCAPVREAIVSLEPWLRPTAVDVAPVDIIGAQRISYTIINHATSSDTYKMPLNFPRSSSLARWVQYLSLSASTGKCSLNVMVAGAAIIGMLPQPGTLVPGTAHVEGVEDPSPMTLVSGPLRCVECLGRDLMSLHRAQWARACLSIPLRLKQNEAQTFGSVRMAHGVAWRDRRLPRGPFRLSRTLLVSRPKHNHPRVTHPFSMLALDDIRAHRGSWAVRHISGNPTAKTARR